MCTGPPFVPDALPFEPLDLSATPIAELIAACDIVHGVGAGRAWCGVSSHTPWCFHRTAHETLVAFPDWAHRTLVEHRSDPRPSTLSWETLARAKSGDALWDAAQRSLLIHGELYNNVRMTWVEALLEWTESPERCLETLIDLNHRYALDGQDPNSYGGLLDAFAAELGRPSPPVSSLRAHRWRYALASEPVGGTCLFDPQLEVGACHGWCLGGRIEAAFLSGRATAGRLLAAER